MDILSTFGRPGVTEHINKDRPNGHPQYMINASWPFPDQEFLVEFVSAIPKKMINQQRIWDTFSYVI